LESLVTTLDAGGVPHLAPMGPRVAPDWSRFTLRPFPTSQTYKNLLRHGEGVIHITDDALLLAKAAVGTRGLSPAEPGFTAAFGGTRGLSPAEPGFTAAPGGEGREVPPVRAAERVRGFVLVDCCRYFEFKVRSVDDSAERVTIEAEVVHAGRVRDFFGFNRAKHAVVEAAILATRLHILPLAEVAAEFAKLRVIVGKTGGPDEFAAMDLLERRLREAGAGR
jgi:hypothetical protein